MAAWAPYAEGLGTAINAYVSAQIAKENIRAQTADLQRRLTLQKQLLDEEQGRQQEFTRGSRDALDSSVGLYGNFQGQIDQEGGVLGQMFRDALNAGIKPENVPAAVGAVAERQAGMIDQANARSANQATNLGRVQGFDRAFQNVARQQGNNQTIAEILNNFASGSRAALEPALQMANTSTYVAKPNTNYLGDMLLMGAGLSNRFAKPSQPTTSPFALMQPGMSAPRMSFDGLGGERPKVQPTTDGIKLRGLGF